MDDQSIVGVTQADRDDAADWHQAQGNWIVDWHAMRRGEMDDCGTVQAFARHRIAEREACAAMLEQAISEGYPTPVNKVDACTHGKFGWEDCIACYDERLMEVAAAIRARS